MITNVRCAMWYLVGVVLLFCITQESFARYIPPTPSVEPLYPKGLRMYIPHEDGISLVAYHVKFNEDFEGLEAGTIARDIVKIRNNRWQYEDRTTRLKPGDKIYYWIHVVYDGLGYNLIDKSYTVKDFYNYDGGLVTSTAPSGGQSCAIFSETKIIEKDGKRVDTCSGQFIFEENFDTLNRSRWTLVERFSGAPDFEFVLYEGNNEHVEVKDGNLHVKLSLLENKHGTGFAKNGTLTLDKCTGVAGSADCQRSAIGSYILPPIISGRLNTKNAFSFMYGRIQVRAKLPRGDWIYPVISLEAEDQTVGTAATQCEIKIASAAGNAQLRSSDGSDFSGKLLTAGWFAVIGKENPHNNQQSLPMKVSDKLWSSDYHTYELEWRRGGIIARVDGEQYGEQTLPLTFDRPVYLNLGVAVGGHVMFPDKSISGDYNKPWRNVESKALFKFYRTKDNWFQTWKDVDTSLHIDYIKVWAL